jgi:hypothetical protein
MYYADWDSSVSVVTRLWVSWQRNWAWIHSSSNKSPLPPQKKKYWAAFGFHPLTCSAYTRVCLPLGMKWPRQTADYSLPHSAKVTNAWNCLSTIRCIFIVWYLIQHRDKFSIIDLFVLVSILIFVTKSSVIADYICICIFFLPCDMNISWLVKCILGHGYPVYVNCG